AELRDLDNVLQVLYGAIERILRVFALGHAATAVVVANEAVVLCEELDPVAPHRAIQLILEMGQPIRRFHERRSVAHRRPRERRAVERLRQAYRLAHLDLSSTARGNAGRDRSPHAARSIE